MLREEANIVIGRPIDESVRPRCRSAQRPRVGPTVREPQQVGETHRSSALSTGHAKPVPGKHAPITVRIMNFDPPRRFTARSEDAQGFYEYRYELEPVDGGTRITHRTESHFTSLLRFIAPLLKGHLRKVMNGQLQDLKALLEGRSP